MKATFVKNIEGWTGDAKLYHLDPPMVEKSYDEEELDKRYEYVVVSATVAMFSGSETYVFGADKDGKVEDWRKLDGSYRGGLSHEAALRGAGYEVHSPKEAAV